MTEAYTASTKNYETDHKSNHIICWRSAIAGLAVALVLEIGLLALATAFGGIALFDGTTAQRAGAFAIVAVMLSTVISLFFGGYFAARIRRNKVSLVGSAQGLLVGALALFFMVTQIFSAMGGIASGLSSALGSTVNAASAAAMSASQNPAVRDMMENALGDLKLKSDPEVVFKDVGSRLLRGDQEGAKLYLANQAGITPAQADQKINAAKAQVEDALKKSREAAATAMKDFGWSLFLMIALGLMASTIGGALAAYNNQEATLETRFVEVNRTQRA